MRTDATRKLFAMTIGVLALQGDFESHRAMLDVAQQGGALLHGEALRVLAVRDARGLEQCDALVIPGGESTVMSRLCDRYDLWEPLRARLDEGMGAFGTCAGMILLACKVEGATRNFQQKTLGALDIDVARNAYGAQADSFEADIALSIDAMNDENKGRAAPHEYSCEQDAPVPRMNEAAKSAAFVASQETASQEISTLREAPQAESDPLLRAVFIRAPRITRCGPDVEVLARHEGFPVVVRHGRVMAASFHPEIAGDAQLHVLWLRSLQA